VRLLAPFDATILGHADRTRVMTDHVRRQVIDGAAVEAVVLIDGTVAGTWRSTGDDDGVATLTVRPLRALAVSERDDVEAEAARLLAFTDPDAAERRVVFSPPGP
jgi:hypothetical protein